MKVFKYKFTKLTTALIYVGLALSVVVIGFNIFSIVTRDASDAVPAYSIIQYTLLFFVPVVLIVILVSLLISSYYSVDEKTLKTSFGVIKSKYDINEIETVMLDRTTNKLTVFFKNKSFIVIVVKEEWYDDFINALLAVNRKIEYSIKSKENRGDDGKDKKEK